MRFGMLVDADDEYLQLPRHRSEHHDWNGLPSSRGNSAPGVVDHERLYRCHWPVPPFLPFSDMPLTNELPGPVNRWMRHEENW